MPHVTGIATIVIGEDGRRTVTTRDLQVNPNPKPLTLQTSGSDPEIWARIRAGEVGTHETVAHFGGATALMVPRTAIALPGADFLTPMQANFGELGPEALLGAVRTGASAATQFCVDTCGGMFTSLDWTTEALASMLKILVFKPDGWVRLWLPQSMAKHQEAFAYAQRQRWIVAREGFSPAREAELEFLRIGRDSFDGEPTLVVFGPLGDCQFIRVARLELEGEDFRFCDGEWRGTPGAYEPLNRQIVATTTVANHPGVPLILQLHPDGHLHQGGLHVFADVLNRRLYSHNPARVLGPQGLGWLRVEMSFPRKRESTDPRSGRG